MNTSLDCLPCLANLALNLVRRMTDDIALQRDFTTEALHALADGDLRLAPPRHAEFIIRKALHDFPNKDPYQQEKDASAEMAKKLIQRLKEDKNLNCNDFETRLRLAIAGNILDFGIFLNLDIQDALNSVWTTLNAPLDINAVKRLETRIQKAENILYLLDNCGEAVFDRLFIEPFRSKVTLAVRGGPTLNDVTQDDLIPSGLGNGFTRNIVTHDGCTPGISLSHAGHRFQEAFLKADLIIAKGQGNFETLSDTDRPVAFLFLAKCPVVVRKLNTEPRSIQVRLANC